MPFMLSDKYALVSLDAIYGLKPGTNELKFILDEIKNGNISGEAEISWMTGRRGRRLAAIKSNKTCTITADNGYIVGGLLAAQIGDENPVAAYTTPDIEAPMFERITVGAGTTVQLAHEAVGDLGNEVKFIYKANKDGSQGEVFAQAATASATEFAFDGTKQITLPTGKFAAGDVVIVFYNYKTKGVMYTNRSADYAGSAKLICTVMVKDICSGAEKVSTVTFPKAEISDNFSINFGTDVAVHGFEAQAVADACAGEQSDYFYWIVPDDEV